MCKDNNNSKPQEFLMTITANTLYISSDHNWTNWIKNWKDLNSYLENLKTCNVQDADEGGTLSFGPVQSSVNAMNQPAEQTLVCGFSQSLHSKVRLEGGREEWWDNMPGFCRFQSSV